MNLKIPIAIGLLALSLSIGIIIGYFGIQSKNKNADLSYEDLIFQFDARVGLELLDKELSKDNIKNHLKYMQL
jgi:hypothetical protein